MPPDRPVPRPEVGWPAMVLTAGLGTRLHPLTAVRAKPAVPVAGQPLAGRILTWLASWGVRDAVLNLHHRPDTVTGAVGDGRRFGVRVRYSWEPVILGSAGGPARALPLLDAPRFLLVNGDTLTNVDLATMAREHAGTGARVTMAVVPNPDPRHYGGVLVSPDGALAGFSRRGPQNAGWHFVGIQIVEAEVFAGLAPDTPAESVAGVYRELVAADPGAVRAFRCDASFHDIGTAADYLETSLAFARLDGAGEAVLCGDGCRVAPEAHLDRCVLWDRVRVGSGAALESCVVASPGGAPSPLGGPPSGPQPPGTLLQVWLTGSQVSTVQGSESEQSVS